jgi:DNA-binding PadR family transcriptional regulator
MTERRRSPLGLILLLNLLQGPSHSYRLHKLLEQTGKDRIVNVKSRASVYQAIERLQRDGLIEPAGTSSMAGYPDRIEYTITNPGRSVATDWLRELLASTSTGSPEFIVALSTIFILAPDDARTRLEARREQLLTQLTETDQAINGPDVPPGLPRLFLLDEHYRQAILTAELAWTEQTITDLANGNLNWNREWLEQIAAQYVQSE